MAIPHHFDCAIVTPEAKVFEGSVDFVSIPAHDGEIGILPNRAPLLCKLGIGVLRVRTGQTTTRWFVDGGFAQVVGNHLTILTQQALPPDSIDPAAAERALAQAAKMPATDEASRQARQDAVARARAQLRLRTSR